MPPAADQPPILFLHSVFGHPALCAGWLDFLRAAGFECHAPSMPGRNPTDHGVLSASGVAEFYGAAVEAYDNLGAPAVVIGHSIGGLLGQKLAAERDLRAEHQSHEHMPHWIVAESALEQVAPPVLQWLQRTLTGLPPKT